MLPIKESKKHDKIKFLPLLGTIILIYVIIEIIADLIIYLSN
jgi:hypothetical protein